MNDEMGNIFENETTASPDAPSVNSRPADTQDATVVPEQVNAYSTDENAADGSFADIPTVEAEQVCAEPVDTAQKINPATQPEAENAGYAEYSRQAEQYSPYGTRQYNPQPETNHNRFNAPNYAPPVYSSMPVSEPAKAENGNKGIKIFAGIVSVILVFALVFGGVVAMKYVKGLLLKHLSDPLSSAEALQWPRVTQRKSLRPSDFPSPL